MRNIDPGRVSEEYKEWRRKVRKRDGAKCKWPDCNKRGQEVHHIIPYSVAPHLRYEVANGILLCKKCHKNLKNKELFYANMFISIIEGRKK